MPVQYLSADGLKLVRDLIKKFPNLSDNDDANRDKVLALVKYLTEAIDNNVVNADDPRSNLEVIGLRMKLELIRIDIDHAELPDINELQSHIKSITSLFRGGRTKSHD